jgi:hypothetical protein
MKKALIALALIFAVSAQPALAARSQSSHQQKADAAKVNVTENSSFANSECKKYFAVIGSLVTVPCSK